MDDFDALLSSLEEPDPSSKNTLCDIILDLCRDNAAVNVMEREVPEVSSELRTLLVQDIVQLFMTHQLTSDQSIYLLDEVRRVIEPRHAQPARR
ncbi:hypothetical protein W02_24700 [Nitrospira sp. KM1]|uniref:hypothetical protein n=1 Tax=Nitrospira sp. KM1 TaxID=1936990 RepID=UPI0013A7905D|nr:hypothetical protein [Nitrospira sp. KM1]BCA55330.1 hypothetical protein W02_24700 [Nitrospira sp. KM1]